MRDYPHCSVCVWCWDGLDHSIYCRLGLNPEECQGSKEEKKLRPEILCQPHIPKPMHGLSPRTIMGQVWWDEVRQKVYASTGYHCIACGVHKFDAKGYKWLEAHENWKIDYKKGVCEILSIEPLCHYCHNFIHSGRLYIIMKQEKLVSEVRAILEHGLGILTEHKLKCFPFTLDFAQQLKCQTFGVKAYQIPTSSVAWEDWKLVWNGKEYQGKFKSFKEWEDYYPRGGG